MKLNQYGLAVTWIIIALFSMSSYCCSAGEQQFGRLFTTQEERQRLQGLRVENMRTNRSRDNTGTGARARVEGYNAGQSQGGISRGSVQGKEDSPVITLKGLIYKKDRARMAWVDAKEGTAALDYRELESGQIRHNEVTIELPMTGKSVKLKPGQSYHLHSGAITDLKDGAP